MSEEGADRLRKARIEAGFEKKADGARAAGVKPSTYNAHENGQNSITSDFARLYGVAFKVDPGWLMEMDKDAARPGGQKPPMRAADRFQFTVKPPVEIWKSAIQTAIEHIGVEPSRAAAITEVILSVAYAQLPAGLGMTEEELARQLVQTGLTKRGL